MKNIKNYKWEAGGHTKKMSPILYTVQLKLQKEGKRRGRDGGGKIWLGRPLLLATQLGDFPNEF